MLIRFDMVVIEKDQRGTSSVDGRSVDWRQVRIGATLRDLMEFSSEQIGIERYSSKCLPIRGKRMCYLRGGFFR